MNSEQFMTYVVKDMKANLIMGEDTQLAWQLNTICKDGQRLWQVGNSDHQIPSVSGPARRSPSLLNGILTRLNWNCA